MAVPATMGILRTKIEDMKIGDYIKMHHLSGGNYPFFALTTDPLIQESELTGNVLGPNARNKFLYMVKVSKGLLIADRVHSHTYSWDSYNSLKWIQGLPVSLGDINGTIRSLTGGVAYADANGNSTATNLVFGAFPTNNEWDKYIVNFPVEMIQSGKTLDDVFHWGDSATWTQDTHSINGATNRVLRGRNISSKNLTIVQPASSSSTYDWVGFRPVFEYNENQFA